MLLILTIKYKQHFLYQKHLSPFHSLHLHFSKIISTDKHEDILTAQLPLKEGCTDANHTHTKFAWVHRKAQDDKYSAVLS